MTTEQSRRDFLRGAFGARETDVLRPPGFDPQQFSALCRDCDACHAVCPEQIIVADSKGKARLDFNAGECTFCGACAEACPTGALLTERVPDWPWKAQIAASCLSLNGTACRSCQDACDAGAIRFTLMPGGKAQPVLDQAQCTGCGACVFICPAQAVDVVRNNSAACEAAE